MSWTNSDGLTVLMHGEQGQVNVTGGSARSGRKMLVVSIPDATAVGTTAATPSPLDAFVPAGSYIVGAWTFVGTAFTSAGAATLGIGLYKQDGTTIDADGIDAAIAKTALGAGVAVANDGAMVGGTVMVGTDDAYVGVLYGTAAFTAGDATIVIEYIEP